MSLFFITLVSSVIAISAILSQSGLPSGTNKVVHSSRDFLMAQLEVTLYPNIPQTGCEWRNITYGDQRFGCHFCAQDRACIKQGGDNSFGMASHCPTFCNFYDLS
jgi:hypothetical protein